MAIYPIRTFGDPVLRATAADVNDDAESLERLVADMLETMYEAPGVGLAAPQIGISKRIFVADIGEGPFTMVNPEIVDLSGTWTFDEGCLSVPGYYWPIKRPDFAKARGFDIEGNPVEFEGEELMGRVLQHEIDHLHGMLLLERLSRRAKKQALRDIREDSVGSAGHL
ncbi:MAG: peptide deformylase [bacterium]|nr:peptide deformylase [bacterium]